MKNYERLTPWRLQLLASAFLKFDKVRDFMRLESFWECSGSSEAEEKVFLCIQRAELFAKTSSEWGQIAEVYSRHFMNFRRHLRGDAIRCMKHAESVALTSSDWLSCAVSWYVLSNFDGDKSAVRCIGCSVKMAETSYDFEGIACWCVLLWRNLPAAEVMMNMAEDAAVTVDDWNRIKSLYDLGYSVDMRIRASESPVLLPFEIIGRQVIGPRECS